MKKLIIVGAGGFGREVLQWALQSQDCNAEWEIAGFLDDNLNSLEEKHVDYRVLGTIKDWTPKPEELFVCAIAFPETKEKIVNSLKAQGANFISLIHPTAIIATSARIGEGVVLCPFTMISADTVIGNFVMLNVHTSVGHDAFIGNYSTFNSYCDITGCVEIREKVFAGTSVKIVPSRKIGASAFLCAGSVILTNVKEGAKVIGNPAKTVGL